MSLLLNKAHYPVEVLGPGKRVGLWLQGCTIRCFGCISRDTWVADPRTAVEVASVIDWIDALPTGAVDGVTISGGEPFDQPDGLAELLEALDDWRTRQRQPIDILCYSGRSYSELVERFAPLLNRLDAVVPEPYVQGDPTPAALRGSANQPVVALSELGRARFSEEELALMAIQRERIQIDADEESIWFIGIPEQGAMRRIQEQASAVGISIRRPSWLL